jgi:hypothetical protein
MMRKGQAVHYPRHLDVGEQYVDAAGMVPQNNQGGFGVLGFHNLETFIKQRLNNNEPDQLFVLGDEDKNLIRHNIRLSRFRHAPATAREAQSFLKIGFVNEIGRRRENLGLRRPGWGLLGAMAGGVRVLQRKTFEARGGAALSEAATEP